MREIKFRAWHLDHLGTYSMHDSEQVMSSLKQYLGDSKVMQFTGLKDKDGVDIYEGDIVEYSNKLDHHAEFSHVFVIEFGEQDLGHNSYQQTIGWNATRICQFGKPSRMDSGRLSHGVLDLFGCHNVKVIGNIYENPELLTEVE